MPVEQPRQRLLALAAVVFEMGQVADSAPARIKTSKSPLLFSLKPLPSLPRCKKRTGINNIF
jgi:hypothetical protein